MSRPFRIALTADLHWGHRRGADATRLLADFLRASPPDLLVLAGDVGTGILFGDCLGLFADLPCLKALVPGNHDLWVLADDALHDSLTLYREILPALAEEHGFHYLDGGPLVLPEVDLAVVGSVNWYDYSWAIDGIRRYYPDEEGRLQSKRFTRGKHNDGNFVRWPIDDPTFTASVADALERHLLSAFEKVSRAVVVTHHPPFQGLSFPRPGPPVFLDSFLWDAFSGNRTVEEMLRRHTERVAFAFCGHTHRERENTLSGVRGYNIGGDYHYKRLLWLEWPAGSVMAHTFGVP